MQKDLAIARIKELETPIRLMGAAALYVFGSTARNAARPDSDIDILVDPLSPDSLGFPQFFELQDLLERHLHCRVDLAKRSMLHPMLRSTIEASAIRVL